MLPIDEITNALPSPREDEPSSLRQDIVDEILDHLRCALRRQRLINGGDEVAAQQHVLSKFGNPGQVARKLWYQAMWSKIMTQRLIIGTSIVSLMVCAFLAIMVGVLVQQIGRQQIEQQRHNAALIEQFAKLIPQPQRDLRWNNLKIKVTTGSEAGPPATGYTIQVSRQPGIGEVALNGSQHFTKIDESGVADCGYVEPGIYNVNVMTPWHEQSVAMFTIHPGNDHLQQIVAPAQRPDLTGVKISVDGVPKFPPQLQIALFMQFRQVGTRTIANQLWGQAPGGFIVTDSTPSLLIVPNHGVWICETANDALGSPPHIVQVAPGTVASPRAGGMFGTPPQVAQSAKWLRLDPSHIFNLPNGRYSINFDLIFLRGNVQATDPNFVAKDDDGVVRTIVSPDDPKWPKYVTTDSWPGSQWTHVPQEFAAELGKTNEWMITLPEDVTNALRRGTAPPSGFAPASSYPAPAIRPIPAPDETEAPLERPVPVPLVD